MNKVAASRELGRKLIEAGIVPKDTRRVVIDIPCDGAVVLYVECLGDQRLLELGTDDFKNAVVIRSVAMDEMHKPCLHCGIVKPISERCANCAQEQK
jgi:hypothetical protein